MEQSALKVYMADTGLLVTLAFSDSAETGEEVYRAVLLDDLGINEGMLTENLVAQMLVAAGHRLFFYSQSGRREGEERMEIDFLAVRPYADAAMKPRVSPIEVKSGKRYSPVSLNKFKAKFGKRVGTEFVLHTKPLKVEGDRVFLPLYMSICL
jgi:predicted AAA+ superfamily ATPase